LRQPVRSALPFSLLLTHRSLILILATVNPPTPAIVAQDAVQRFPRLVLWLFCAAYVLPGFLFRGPWKRADITTFGYMAELARGASDWWKPTLGGLNPDVDALLPYWLGAWAIQMSPSWLSTDFAARLPFMLLLVMALLATWYGIYYLARSPQAQPVAFAFGGEAPPTDYACAVADGGVLAFMACLGLAQLAHETTPALTQLCFTALLFYATAAIPYQLVTPGLGAAVGLTGLTLSGAPSMALALGTGCAAIYLIDLTPIPSGAMPQKWRVAGIFGMSVFCAALATQLDLWQWRIDLPSANWVEWQSLGNLFLWFTWPAWPLALWTLWRWHHHLFCSPFASRHLWLPLWFVAVASAATLTTSAADRSLLLALPALAALAAFALPTLGRSLGALIDWFTLIFFSGCALIIWVVWISMQTGFPPQPALNVARLAPGFTHSFSFIPFCIAICASATWAWLVKWRVGRHPSVFWKSVVLPAGGTALCWLLLMTLWLPLLDFARSYAPMMQQVTALLPKKTDYVCTLALSRSQTTALQFHGHLNLQPLETGANCLWLITNGETSHTTAGFGPGKPWQLRSTVSHPADLNEKLYLFERSSACKKCK
jgi:4-amino-4-deoxy-L-arabinose transferase-like glycosyltransferase